MLDPTNRVWLCFLALYGEASMKRFVKFTMNDGPGVAFKAGRVIKQRIAYLKALVSSNKKAKDDEGGCPWKDTFAPMHKMIEANKAAFAEFAGEMAVAVPADEEAILAWCRAAIASRG